MINKLLITCLQRNKRLIIPTLGAFIRKNIEGVGVILVFVPFLNKDDGVLINALQSWAGVEKEEAEIILKEYVDCIKNSLNTRGQYIIEGIGVLKYDANMVVYLAKEGEANKPEVAAVEQQTVSAPAPVIPQPLPQPVAAPEPIAPAPKPPVVVPVAPPVYTAAPVPAPQPVAEPVYEEPTDDNDNFFGDFEDQKHTPTARPDVVQPPAPTTQPTQSAYNQTPQRGTRYFSSEPREQQDKPAQAAPSSQQQRPSTLGEQIVSERKSTINNLYGGGKSSTIYGSTALDRGSRQPSNIIPPVESETEEMPPMGAPTNSNRKREGVSYTNRNPYNNQPVKKKVDMVIIIAVIAIIVTVCSIIYAFVWGSETSLQDEIVVEQTITPDVSNAAQSADSVAL